MDEQERAAYEAHRAKMRSAGRFFASVVRNTMIEDLRPEDPLPDFRVPDQIRPQLFLSSSAAEAYKHALDEAKITHVLQVGHELHISHPQSFSYLKIPVHDSVIEDIVTHFASAFSFIDQAINSGGNVLVHCQAGVSRSPTIVIGYLMWKDKAPYEPLRSAVAAARRQVNPNLGFKAQLLEFQERGFSWEGWKGWSRERFMGSKHLTEQQKSDVYIDPII